MKNETHRIWGGMSIFKRSAVRASMIIICVWFGVTSCSNRAERPSKRESSGATSKLAVVPLAPNVLLISVDTTRADHLGCYGNLNIKTPNMDALAADGVLFEEAFSVQPVTLPAHCSIHTGKYPFRHGVRDNSIYELGDENETMAEVLTGAGYLTTAFVASYILNHRFGLSQGFQFYNDRFVKPKQKGRLPVDRRASEVSFLATEWLREVGNELKERPFLLWLHYYDPHADYDPPQPYGSAYGNPYDGEIAYLDDWLGFLFDELKKADKWENTMVILVGDHGEGFGDHGENTHGMFIYRATTHVPLIVKFPDNRYAGKRVSSRVSQVDILPTVLDELNRHGNGKLDGKSLLPLIEGTEHGDRDVYSETYIPRSFHWSELRGIRSGENFFIEAPLPELYRISDDPNEKANLYNGHNGAAEQLSQALSHMAAQETASKSSTVVLSDEMAARLEQLGYFIASVGLADASEGELPDPKTRINLFNGQQQANNLMDNGRWDEALVQYESLVKQDGDNPRLLMELAKLYGELQQYKKAEKLYLRAAVLDSENARLYALLGLLYRGWEQTNNAKSSFEKAIALNDRDYISMFHLALIAMEGGFFVEAKAYLKRAVAIHPNPAAYNNLGYVTIKGLHQYEAGIQYLKKAVQLATDKSPFLFSLGVAFLENGQSRKAVPVLKEAVELVPDNIEYIETLIRACRAAGDETERLRMEQRLALLQKRSAAIQ